MSSNVDRFMWENDQNGIGWPNGMAVNVRRDGQLTLICSKSIDRVFNACKSLETGCMSAFNGEG